MIGKEKLGGVTSGWEQNEGRKGAWREEECSVRPGQGQLERQRRDRPVERLGRDYGAPSKGGIGWRGFRLCPLLSSLTLETRGRLTAGVGAVVSQGPDGAGLSPSFSR